MSKIKVIKSCTIDKISGQPGNFDTKFIINGTKETETVKVGAIVQATGWKQYKPEKLGELGYGKFDNVITSIQLEESLKLVRVILHLTANRLRVLLLFSVQVPVMKNIYLIVLQSAVLYR